LSNKPPLNDQASGGMASSLNTHFNRNYSFVYDHSLKRYDYQYNHDDDDEDETDRELQGFWGYLRDKNADRKLNTCNLPNKKETSKDNETGYWGIFRERRLDGDDDDGLDKHSESSSLSASFSLSSSINSLSRFKDSNLDTDYNENEISRSLSKGLSSSFRDFDYKTSKFKIQARKRDE
jgi:hypothetical protein